MDDHDDKFFRGGLLTESLTYTFSTFMSEDNRSFLLLHWDNWLVVCHDTFKSATCPKERIWNSALGIVILLHRFKAHYGAVCTKFEHCSAKSIVLFSLMRLGAHLIRENFDNSYTYKLSVSF